MADSNDHTHDPLASREVAAFLAAVDTGTIQGAAEALFLTQSAATKRIQSLERQLGQTLLNRGRNGVTPTEAGRKLYPDARRALAALAAAQEAVLEQKPGGTIKLAASRTVGGYVLPGMLAEFRVDHPDLRPQVNVVNSPGVLRLVRQGEVCIGFVEGDDPLADLERLDVADDEIVVAVAAGHRWAELGRIDSAQLPGERYVTREPGSGTRAVAEHRLAAHGVELTPEIETASLEGVKRALLDGGFTLISSRVVEVEVRLGNIVTLPVEDVDLNRRLVAVRPVEAPTNVAADQLWSWLGKSNWRREP